MRKHVHTRRRSSLWWLQPVISQTLLGGRSSFSEESSKSKGKKQTSKRDNGKAESGCTGCLASGTSLPAAEGRVSPRAARPGLRTARLARSGERRGAAALSPPPAPARRSLPLDVARTLPSAMLAASTALGRLRAAGGERARGRRRPGRGVSGARGATVGARSTAGRSALSGRRALPCGTGGAQPRRCAGGARAGAARLPSGTLRGGEPEDPGGRKRLVSAPHGLRLAGKRPPRARGPAGSHREPFGCGRPALAPPPLRCEVRLGPGGGCVLLARGCAVGSGTALYPWSCASAVLGRPWCGACGFVCLFVYLVLHVGVFLYTQIASFKKSLTKLGKQV